MTSTAEQMRRWQGPAVLTVGFRLFFLAAGIWAFLAMVLWIVMLSGAAPLPVAFDAVSWHAHEFLWGYTSAVITGFLLTAVPNWTGRLPVVGRDDAQRVLGVIRRGDIIRAYRIGLARRTAEQHRTQWASQPTGDDTTFVEIGLVSGDRAVGRKVADLGPELPRDCILVSVQRAGRTLIPDGGTRLEPGDLLTVFVRSRYRAGLLGCLRSDAAARLAHAEDAEG